ncbi:hypothetical protein [uncultured Winogradskyella sp.]|uniref:hypothetical protein n=1 Tax=uncultured Winogradskyella sp. TaxID=395353 RepID=UPI0030DC3D90|tara:strand:- start:277818 stop:279056 length:1239 start_codon:yes stop_codon:yes gene_type:complete
MKKTSFLWLGLFLSCQLMFAQGAPDYSGGMKVKLNEDGTKYFRIISWAQMWAQNNGDRPNDANGNEQSATNFSIRRARVLMYAQLNKDFLILTHFGLNSLNADNMSAVGTGDNSQLFFHDVWGQFRLTDSHAIGGGLHYWNGISRANNQSTLNMMTLDNTRQAWATIGLSDQFARHMGVYFKGKFGKLQYRISVNDAITNNLQAAANPTNGATIYSGRRLLGSKEAGRTYAGYFDYNFLDQESNFLPYKVGTYLGGKKVFNVGAGFFLHPKGAVSLDASNNLTGEDVSIFALDAFYDAPIGQNGAAVTAYALAQFNDYGENFTLGQTYESGSMLHAHLGYVIPSGNTTKFQPYFHYTNRSIDAIDDSANQFGIGANAYFSGHHSKLTLEYQNTAYGNLDAIGTVTLQAMIYL